MSAQYFDCYIDKNDAQSLLKLREFFNLTQANNWEKIIEIYEDKAKLAVGYDEDSEIEKAELFKDFAHYFDGTVNESITAQAICFSFDTPCSFHAESFMMFLNAIGMERIETCLYDSQVGEYGFMLNEKYMDYIDEAWKWMPEPEEDDEE